MTTKLHIVIATRNRVDKLRTTLKSIPYNLPGVDILVGVDGDTVTKPMVKKEFPHVAVQTFEDHMGSVSVRNRVISEWCTRSSVLYFVDDAEFLPGSLEKAIEDFSAQFPDTDGVVGLTLQGHSFHPTAMAIIGNKFLDRYPHRMPFFPGYWHFACQEVHWLAMKLNKFYLSPAKVIHHHAAFDKKLVDQTHNEARSHMQYDKDVRTHRKSAGCIWGETP